MKNISTCLLFSLLLFSNNTAALDCAYRTISENFIKHNTVFIAEILNQENEIINGEEVTSWNLKIKKTFKGNPVKKIVTGGMWPQFKKVNSGDIIVVFGGNHYSNKYVTCSACSYSRIIKKAENKRNKKYRDLTRVLKLNKKLLKDQKKSYAFCPKRSMREHPNYGEFGSVQSLNKKNKLIHILTNVNKDGKAVKYKFINIKNEQYKKELIKILGKRKWKTEQDITQLIESFYYNKNGIKKYDY